MRLLVIEDEEDLLNAITLRLRQEGYAVDTATDGQTGLVLAEVNSYDLLILDLNLPGLDGLEICRKLRAAQPRLLILILTARSQPDQRVSGLDLGADDYMVKPFYFQELLARIRVLFRRDLPNRHPFLEYGPIKIDPTTKTAWKNQLRLELTNKEWGILEYLLRRPGEIVTQEDLLEHVWDVHANPFSGTVRVHLNSLRRKLANQTDTFQYIETLFGQGYRLKIPTNQPF